MTKKDGFDQMKSFELLSPSTLSGLVNLRRGQGSRGVQAQTRLSEGVA